MNLRLSRAALALAVLTACSASAQSGATSPRAIRQWINVSGDGEACRASLRAAGVRFQALPDREAPDARGCGMPHGVVVTRGPTGIAYAGGMRVDCSFALRLAAVERIVQEEARAQLASPIVRIATLGAYNCRPMRGWSAALSEHAFGNAVDLARFEPRRGRAVPVARDYERGATEPTTARGRFLRNVYERLNAADAVSRVKGPDDDALHADHFHIDRGARWWRW